MTEPIPTLTEQLERDSEEMRSIVQMRLRAIDQRLETINAERFELQSSKKRYNSFLHNLDGTGVHASKNRGQKSSGSSSHRFSDEKIQASIEWLQEHREWLNEGQGFSVPSLLKEEKTLRASPLPAGQSQLSKTLNQLHEREILALSEWAGHRGSQKFYKVI